MEFIQGSKIRDILDSSNCEEIGRKIAESVAKLHNYNIIHGDLTTSNMILSHTDKTDEQSESIRVFFIDFGLGFRSQKTEDKAIDLYLLHEALESTHFDILKKIWKIILETYKQSYDKAEQVIKTLSDIEKRGRYRKR